mgnify:FL=1
MLTVKASLEEAERAKIVDESPLCHSNGYLFCPMGWHPWGGLGPNGAALQRRLEKLVAGDAQGWARSRKLQAFRQPVQFALMQCIGQQLGPALEARSNHRIPLRQAQLSALPESTCAIAAVQVGGWAEEEEDDDAGMARRPARLQRLQ